MSQITESIAQVQASLNQLIRVVVIQEAMEKQDHARRTKAAKKVDELRATGKFIRYKDGKAIYGIGLHKFTDLCRDAGAVYKINGICLVNVEILDKYLETFKLPPTEY